MAPLPRSLDPLPGESLPGYLLRLSFRLGLTPAELGRIAGLVSTSGGYLPRRLILGFAGHAIDEFTQATRLSRAEASALTLGTWRQNYPPIQRWLPPPHGPAPQMDKWLPGGLTRYCPRCLAGDGSPIQGEYGGPWKKEWHLGIVFACPQHDGFLQHRCPQGGEPPDYDRATGLIPYDGVRGLHPAECRYPLPPTARKLRRLPCRARLDRAPLPSVRPTRQLLDLQTQLLSLLASRRDDHEVRAYFNDLHLLSVLITASWPHSSHLVDPAFVPAVDAEVRARRTFGTLRFHDAAPGDPVACGAMLGVANSLLHAAAFRDLLADSLESAFTSVPARAGWVRVFAKYETSCSLRLRTAMAPLIRTYSPSPGWTTPRSASPVGYRAEHVPAHLEPDWHDRYFRDLTGLTNHRALRRMAAIQLVQWATNTSVEEATRYLGIAPEKMLQTEDNVLLWLNSSHDFQDFGVALGNLAAELKERAEILIDYKRRREALSNWALTPETWRELTSQLQDDPGKQPVLDDRKRQDASVFVWVRVTHGEHLFAPRPIEATQPPHVQERWAARRNTTWHLLDSHANPGPHYVALRRVLTEYAEDLARSIDREGGVDQRLISELRQ
ncbi:TniQ family protein [Streptomyces albidoflavus]